MRFCSRLSTTWVALTLYLCLKEKDEKIIPDEQCKQYDTNKTYIGQWWISSLFLQFSLCASVAAI